MAHPLTDEQAQAVDLANTGGDLIVEAYAGTGKTHTVVAMANAAPPRSTALYVSFNRAIVDEAASKMPGNVECRTAASLAWRAVGDPWAARSRGPRMKSNEIARHLRLEGFDVNTPWGGRRRLRASFLAGLVMRALRKFSLSADLEPTRFHVPIPRSARDDPAMFAMFKEIAAQLEPLLPKAWAEVTRPDSPLPIESSLLLKMWHLRGPVLPYDRIYFDEAQDANGCMRAVVSAAGAQHIWVGDTYQQINAWNGAVNALARVPYANKAALTRSFRFGPEIAGTAQHALDDLGASHPVIGAGGPGLVAPIEGVAPVRLSRTNAAAVERAFELAEEGVSAHIIGGADDVVGFCRSALALQDGREASHPDLACFDSWAEVLAYVANDELGGDLAALVNLIEEFDAEIIVEHLAHQPSETEAEAVLSTVHKVKGREWPAVQLAGDFTAIPGDLATDIEEVRLLYVAATRAQTHLDITEVPFFQIGAPVNA